MLPLSLSKLGSGRTLQRVRAARHKRPGSGLDRLRQCRWTGVEPLEGRLLMSGADGLEPGLGHMPRLVEGLGWSVSPDAFLVAADSTTTSTGDSLAAAAAATGPGSAMVPYGADSRDSSEFMLGEVLVNLVLFESDGSIDANIENWTSTRVQQVKNEVLEGLTWWEDTLAARFPATPHPLDFQVDFTYTDQPIGTGYEPITRSSGDQGLWIDDFLDAVGYNTTSSLFTDLDQWNHDQRVAKGANWSYTTFVVDSAIDADGKFSDLYFAYAYLGGPFVMMTYDNNGWGISRMGQVLAHETGHVFYALDEYPGSNTYTQRSGYYNTQNLNAADGNPSPSTRVASIMAEAASQNTAWANHTSSPSSLEMLGWRDGDGDRVFDVLDVPLTLTGSGTYDAPAGRYRLSGRSTVGTLANLNPRGTGHALTLNTVDTLEHRLDGGPWSRGTVYGDYLVDVVEQVDVTALGAGWHTIDFRTVVDGTGVTSNVVANSFLINSGPAVNVSPTAGLVTTEAGGTASFAASLNTRPAADVTIAVRSSDVTEGQVGIATLTFTPSNWATAQTVTVRGVDDQIDDGDLGFRVVLGDAISVDPAYSGQATPDVLVTNVDNDTAGIAVSPVTGLSTAEGGTKASFTVVLTSRPLANVAVPLNCSDSTEGVLSLTQLLFTPDTWNLAQTVTVTGVDDSVLDGNVKYAIVTPAAVSADAQYGGLNPADVSLTNLDSESRAGKKRRNTGSGSPLLAGIPLIPPSARASLAGPRSGSAPVPASLVPYLADGGSTAKKGGRDLASWLDRGADLDLLVEAVS